MLQFPFNDSNSQHSCINFICEVKNIRRSNGIFVTSVYRKPIFTGLFTNFERFLSTAFKKELTYTSLFRYFKISPLYIIFYAQVEQLKKIMKTKWQGRGQHRRAWGNLGPREFVRNFYTHLYCINGIY